MRAKTNYILILGSIFFAIFLAEMITRLSERFVEPHMLPKSDSSYYRKKVMEKYPQFSKDYFSLLCQAKYRDYYYISAKFKSTTINSTDYYDARRNPDSAPLGSTKQIVWMFGGSTMLNLTAPDDLTISNQVAKILNQNDDKVTVVNFGMQSFTSSQELIKLADLLRRVPVISRPKVAIFYDGYNDAALSFTV
jgi:hypothetical protein